MVSPCAPFLCLALSSGFTPTAGPVVPHNPYATVDAACACAAVAIHHAVVQHGSADVAKAQLIADLRTLIERQKALVHSRRPPPGGCDTLPPDGSHLVPQLGELPAQRLAKRATASLRHNVNWRRYKEDELEIAVTASDPSLVVPKKLLLTYEKNQFSFDYEIQASDKAGDFTLTLTPAKGEPVVVRVTVR